MSDSPAESGATLPGLLEFDCPRCGRPAIQERFYGPCPACVAQLRGAGLDKADVQVDDYAPKMNVTPNFIATKD